MVELETLKILGITAEDGDEVSDDVDSEGDMDGKEEEEEDDAI